MKRPLLLMLCAGVLTACEAPPRAPPVAPAPAAPAPEMPPQPEPPPSPEPESQPMPPGQPASPDARQQAQKAALQASDLLQAGHEDTARNELRRALALDAQNKLALSLNRQLTSDPAVALGRESFAYTVRPGDTLAALAQRQLGDAFLFYLLARYNDIKVPNKLSAGQVIRLPGKPREPSAPPAPPLTPPPAQPPAQPPVVVSGTASAPGSAPAEAPTAGVQAMREGEAAERTGNLAAALAAYGRANAAGQAGAATKVTQVRTALLNRYTLAARTAFTKQNLDDAIANWKNVLELDPNNTTARSEMERARVMKNKLRDVK